MVTHMGSGTIARWIAAVAIVVLTACSVAHAQPRLTKQRAIRIADTQARRDLDYDLREYRIKSARYLREDTAGTSFICTGRGLACGSPSRWMTPQEKQSYRCREPSNQAMQLTASKPVVRAWSVCRRERMLRRMHRGLAAADLVSR